MTSLVSPRPAPATVARIGSIAAVVLLVVIIGFQLALALGAPWGRAAYGGGIEHPGVALRASSVFAVVLWAFVGLLLLRRGGLTTLRVVPERALPVVVWVVVGVLSVSVILNVITPSAIERAIWAPVTLALLVATLITQLAARRRDRSV